MRDGGFPKRPPQVILALLLAFLAIVAFASLGVGRYDIPLARVLDILLALLTVAGLALSGAARQGVFRNPPVGRRSDLRLRDFLLSDLAQQLLAQNGYPRRV